MEASESTKAYDDVLINATKSMSEIEADSLVAIFLIGLEGLDEGTTTSVDKVDSFYRVCATNKFGTHYLPYYERHIMLYLILVFSAMITNPKQWPVILEAHKVVCLTEGAIGVLFNAMNEFHAMVMTSKMEAEKIIQFPGGDNDRTDN